MHPTYFMTAAAIMSAYAAVRWSNHGHFNTAIKTGLVGLSFWGGIEALIGWGFLHSPL
jgi:hypothetical protein